MSLVHEDGFPRPLRIASAALAAGAVLAALEACEALIALRHVGRATGAFRMVAAPTTVATVLDSLHSTLYYDLGTGAVLVLLFVPLSRVVRQPSRRVRTFIWALAAVAWAMLCCGVATGPDDTSAAPSGIEEPHVLRAWSHLLPGWYTIVHSFTVLALLAAVTAVALLLARSSVGDFYSRYPQGRPKGLWSHSQPQDNTPS